MSKTSRPTAGVALVIVLGFVVLLTIIVVAFLSKTQFAVHASASSAGMLQTDILARSAVETITGDLRAEMLAGAINDPKITNGVVDAMEVCPINADSAQPEYANAPINSEWAAVPARVISNSIDGTSINYANLVKQSVSGKAFYPGSSPASAYTAKMTLGGSAMGAARASNVSTTVPATDGRTIALGRWSTSALLGADLSSTQVPSWIYVNRRGLLNDGSVLSSPSGVTAASDPTASNENFVIGRVAYNIYDTGGLLSANVVGFPQSMSKSDAVYHKGSPAWADGTVLGMTTQQVSDLVAWRNRVSQSAFNPFDNYVHNWAEMQGFLLPYSSGSSSTASTDGYFFGREDLIHYWLYEMGATSYSDLLAKHPEQRAILAKLTGFSAFSTTPSEFTGEPSTLTGAIVRPAILPYSPPTTSTQIVGGNDYYGNNPSTGKKWRYSINPYVPQVLATKAGFTRYRETPGVTAATSGYTRTVQAQRGDVLVNSRFPLSRIALITGGGTDATAISRYFGLTKDLSDGSWIYYHQKVDSGGAPDYSHIETLSEVADPTTVYANSTVPPREPDFFELLQAAIDVGSVGKAGGTASGGRMLYERDTVAQYQIMQIGANIISQADPSGVPIRIKFDPASPGTSSPSYRVFSGVKNLPYLNRYRIIMVQIAGPGVNTQSANYVYGIFIQPEVWNPHDNSVPVPADTPKFFRVVADYNGGWEVKGISSNLTFPDIALTPDGGNAQGQASSGTGIDFTSNLNVSEPVLLSRTISGTVYADGNNTTGAPADTSNLLGMNAGTATSSTAIPGQSFVLHSEGLLDSSTLSFKMQYAQAAGGPWTTYMEYQYAPVEAASGVISTYAPDEGSITASNYCTKSVRADPRTDRFGFWMANGLGYQAGMYPFNATVRPTSAAGFGSWTMDGAAGRGYYPSMENCGWTLGAQAPPNGDEPGSKAIGTICENRQGNVTYYSDADGIYRGGDGYYHLPGTASTSGLMLATGNTPSRPIVLNRPFKSVGELGYVFRDTPLKSLDLFTPDSGDAGLLDYFCIDEQPDNGMVSGHVSLNTRQPDVLAATMATTMCVEPTQTTGADIDTSTEQQAIATAITAMTSGASTGQGPIANRNEIATRIAPLLNATLGNTSSAGKNWIIKRRLETVVRALADSTETGTWNLMVDMVVQAGRFPTTQANPSAGNFVVSGETRQWVHLAIERSTGKVVASFVEPIYE